MNRRTLILTATIAGFVLLASLVFLPMVGMSDDDRSKSWHAIEWRGGTGAWLLLFGWIAAGFAALVCFRKAEYIGIPEDKSRMMSFLGFKLFAFFALTMLIGIDLGEHTGWASGYWLALLASFVGAGAIYLTFNEGLAQKLADKAKEMKENASKPGEDKPADAASGDDATS